MSRTVDNRSQSILVTGAAGFIGANVVRVFLAKGYDIHAIVKSSTNIWRLKDIEKKIHIHAVDLSDLSKLTRLCAHINPYAIFHFAARGSSMEDADAAAIERVNVLGTLNLLLATQKISYHAFINTGSSSEYGFKKQPMRETNILEPVSVYGATKAAVTLLCSVFARNEHKPIVTLRPFSVYGPFESGKRFIPTVIRAILANTPIHVTSEKVRRDFVYIDDVVSAYVAALLAAPRIHGEVFNVGSGEQWTNHQVIQTLFAVTKQSVPIEVGAFPKRYWDTIYWKADRTKAGAVLGWNPQVSLATGLQATYAWFVGHKGLYETAG